jgi:ABC-type xylose transport system substrate-binding protein
MGLGKSDFKIIRVSPTLDTNAYAQNDVLFTATEIPSCVLGLGGCSKLVAMYVIDKSNTDSDIDFYFSEGNTALGTINATADISDANLLNNNICGVARLDANQASVGAGLDNARIFQVMPLTGTSEDSNATMLLQSADDNSSVFVQGILTSATTPTYADGDIQLVFHIQKR